MDISKPYTTDYADQDVRERVGEALERIKKNSKRPVVEKVKKKTHKEIVFDMYLNSLNKKDGLQLFLVDIVKYIKKVESGVDQN
jgi:hypothetical protein